MKDALAGAQAERDAALQKVAEFGRLTGVGCGEDALRDLPGMIASLVEITGADSVTGLVERVSELAASAGEATRLRELLQRCRTATREATNEAALRRVEFLERERADASIMGEVSMPRVRRRRAHEARPGSPKPDSDSEGGRRLVRDESGLSDSVDAVARVGEPRRPPEELGRLRSRERSGAGSADVVRRGLQILADVRDEVDASDDSEILEKVRWLKGRVAREVDSSDVAPGRSQNLDLLATLFECVWSLVKGKPGTLNIREAAPEERRAQVEELLAATGGARGTLHTLISELHDRLHKLDLELGDGERWPAKGRKWEVAPDSPNT
jgi:hypothetical protein